MPGTTAKPFGWLVRVNLAELAANLAKRRGGTWTEQRAAMWLAQAGSSFEASGEWGLFRTRERPEGDLEPLEILSVRPADAHWEPLVRDASYEINATPLLTPDAPRVRHVARLDSACGG